MSTWPTIGGKSSVLFQDERDSSTFRYFTFGQDNKILKISGCSIILIEACNFGLRTRETTETLIRVCYTKTIVVQISKVIVLVLVPIILRTR